MHGCYSSFSPCMSVGFLYCFSLIFLHSLLNMLSGHLLSGFYECNFVPISTLFCFQAKGNSEKYRYPWISLLPFSCPIKVTPLPTLRVLCPLHTFCHPPPFISARAPFSSHLIFFIFLTSSMNLAIWKYH